MRAGELVLRDGGCRLRCVTFIIAGRATVPSYTVQDGFSPALHSREDGEGKEHGAKASANPFILNSVGDGHSQRTYCPRNMTYRITAI